MLCLRISVTNCCNKVVYKGAAQVYNIYMLKLYRDHNSHIAGVYQRDKLTALFLVMKADGIKCLVMSSAAFAKKYTHPVDIDPRKAARTWYCRALTKSRNDPRAFQLLGEYLMEKNLDEMTMEELVEHHNELATGLGKPTVESFKSLKAARAAVAKLNKPVAQKEPKAPVDPEKLGRGPVQGVGAYAKSLLLEGLTNKEVLEKTLEQFPTAKTSVACIAYYRNKLVAAGQLVTQRAKKEAAVTEEAEAQAA